MKIIFVKGLLLFLAVLSLLAAEFWNFSYIYFVLFMILGIGYDLIDRKGKQISKPHSGKVNIIVRILLTFVVIIRWLL